MNPLTFIMYKFKNIIENKDSLYNLQNILISIITIVIAFLVAVIGNSLVYVMVVAYLIMFAYLSRYIGLRKGIKNGFVWGYFLGILGFIIVYMMPDNNIKTENQTIQDNSNKYENLEKLFKLKEAGILTEEEFKIEKEKLLK